MTYQENYQKWLDFAELPAYLRHLVNLVNDYIIRIMRERAIAHFNRKERNS